MTIKRPVTYNGTGVIDASGNVIAHTYEEYVAARIADALTNYTGSVAQSESAPIAKARELAEKIIQVRGGVLGGFPMLQDKADEMSRIAAEILLTLPEAP